MFYYKTLKLKDFPKILSDTFTLSSFSLFALAAANALGELMSYYQLSTGRNNSLRTILQQMAFLINRYWVFPVYWNIYGCYTSNDFIYSCYISGSYNL